MKVFFADAPQLVAQREGHRNAPHGIRYAFKQPDGTVRIGFMGTRSQGNIQRLLSLQFSDGMIAFEPVDRLRDALR